MSIQRYYKHLKPWWQSEEKKLAWFGLLGLITFTVGTVYLTVFQNNWTKNFFDALERKNLHDFTRQVIIFIPLTFIWIANFCALSYLQAWYVFRWRRWATCQLQHQWLSNKNYYRVAQKVYGVDNPDQRIASDTSYVTQQALDLFLSFFHKIINFLSFAALLWQASSFLPKKMFGIPIIPGFLVWAAILYASFGIIVTFKAGRPLIALDREQEKREADFRYRLMRIFERREEIATLSGEVYEENSLRESFGLLQKNFYEILLKQIYINLFQNLYSNWGYFIPLFIVGPSYFSGAITMGILMQVQNMFGQVERSLSSIMFSFYRIASWRASSQRLFDFTERLQEVSEGSKTTGGKRLVLKDITLQTSDGVTLPIIRSIALELGERKLLMAPSGTGKTSLVRAIAGLTDITSKEFVRPKDIMFIPQRTYMPLGTLRQCLSYPNFEGFDDKRLTPLMKVCRLAHLIPALDKVQDYQNILSLGEQQRINFVRVLLKSPKWLIMDEPTSHLNKDYAEELIQLLVEKLSSSGILLISHTHLPDFDVVTPH